MRFLLLRIHPEPCNPLFLFDYLVVQLKHLRVGSIKRLFDFPLNILRRISKNPQPVDLPICSTGNLTSFNDPSNNILHDPFFQVLISGSDLTGHLIFVIIPHLTPSPDSVPGSLTLQLLRPRYTISCGIQPGS